MCLGLIWDSDRPSVDDLMSVVNTVGLNLQLTDVSGASLKVEEVWLYRSHVSATLRLIWLLDHSPSSNGYGGRGGGIGGGE